MPLYTFLFSFKNTCCIRQVEGEVLAEAVDNWLPLLATVQFGKDKSSLDLGVFRQELKEARLVPLRNLHNVWCTFLRIDGTNIVVNVVLTQSESEDASVLDEGALA
jgi:hypothetical protein